MPTGPKGQKRPADVIGNAVKIARIAASTRRFASPPAMAAGISDTVRDVEWIVGMIDEVAAKPKRPARYMQAKAIQL